MVKNLFTIGSRNSKTRAREGGASVFTSFAFSSFVLVPPSEKTLWGFQQAGKKKKIRYEKKSTTFSCG
jgi:hypothetical protein